ncbi:MAG: hypothetical protein J5507_06695 [Clostridia bacterium]|nr:hypothetical protein [Clostridia bacterium]
MKIGVDIDGVLTDLAKFHLDYGTKYAIENNLGEIKDPYGYKIDDIIDLETGKHKDFWQKYDDCYTKNKYTREFASEVLHKLKDEGNEIHIITARNPKTEQKEEWTTSWLSENNICYDKLTFTDKKKDYCKENNIDVMIEDSTGTILEVSELIPVICFDNPHNQDCNGDNIIRCYSWYDIYDKIRKVAVQIASQSHEHR